MPLFNNLFQIDNQMNFRHNTVSQDQDDDIVIIEHVTSQDEDDVVVVSNETSSRPTCDHISTVGGRTITATRSGCGVVPVLGTGAAPPTPSNYQILQSASDVCFAYDGIAPNAADEIQRKKRGIRAATLNSCSPSMSVIPPAFHVENKVRGNVQRKTWGVPMV